MLQQSIKDTLSATGIQLHKLSSSMAEGVPLFSMMRNEKYFLPHFLAHYRSIGVRSFFIFADRCDDEFIAMLEASDDVTILMSRERKFDDQIPLGSSEKPVKWALYLKEFFSNHLLLGSWHLVVDADEFLILPPPATNIDQYVRFLEARGMNYSFAPMVDFYPGRLRERSYDAGLSPFQGCPYFDAGPYHRLDPHGRGIQFLRGGVRQRLIWFMRKNALDKVSQSGLTADDLRMPTNYKLPLLKATPTLKRRGHHWISRCDSIAHSSAIAHFKFYPELNQKISMAVLEKQYHLGSVEYKVLKLALELLEDVDIVFEGSVRYTKPADMVNAHVMPPLGAGARV